MAFDFNHFKQQYTALAKQYALPKFEALDSDFELEKINQESAAVLRVVRKTMMEKILNTLSFLEMLLNPVNVPRMYLHFIKAMSTEDKKIMDHLYSTFGKLSLAALPLEVEYSEKEEAVMIKDIYGIWEECKPELKGLMKRVATPGNEFMKKERSYYG